MRITGAQVAAARALLKMTQAELAAAAGVNEQVVYRFENGLTTPRESTMEALRTALENRGVEFSNGDRPGVILDRLKAVIPT